jgi:NAD(P)-dependent dehydrogenase (short-subunit alcohol dehydrogenase family)
MKGKRVVITGASQGIGRVTAIEIGKMGADLALVVRNRERGEAVADEVRSAGGTAKVYVADLSSLAEIRRVAPEILADSPAIDVLVNNAGALIVDRVVTKDGYEATFATNHLAYFLLTKLLLPALDKADAPRIVNVASEAHRRGTMRFDDLMGEKKWSGLFAYYQSKLANILFTRELARRIDPRITANSLHPGAIASGFARNNKGIIGFGWRLLAPFLLTSEEGAKTSIFLATDPSVAKTTGLYFDKCAERKPSRHGRNDDDAKRLWEISEKLVG